MSIESLILTIISITIAFLSLVLSAYFSTKKARGEANEKDREHVRFMQRIEDKLDSTNVGINQLREKVITIDSNVCDIQNKLAEQEQRIKHLEKEVFKK
jgi:peptidoglycan hydrolase CwlO-like protein